MDNVVEQGLQGLKAMASIEGLHDLQIPSRMRARSRPLRQEKRHLGAGVSAGPAQEALRGKIR